MVGDRDGVSRVVRAAEQMREHKAELTRVRVVAVVEVPVGEVEAGVVGLVVRAADQGVVGVEVFRALIWVVADCRSVHSVLLIHALHVLLNVMQQSRGRQGLFCITTIHFVVLRDVESTKASV